MFTNTKNKIIQLLKWIILAYTTTIIIFIAFSFVLSSTEFPSNYIPTVVILTILVSIMLASFMSSKKLRRNGWLNGSVIGFLYMAINYLLGFILLRDFSIGIHFILSVLFSMLVGALAGVVGINLNHSDSKRIRD